MMLLVSFIDEPRAALEENGRKRGRADGRAPCWAGRSCRGLGGTGGAGGLPLAGGTA